jgi:hypothetical protein
MKFPLALLLLTSLTASLPGFAANPLEKGKKMGNSPQNRLLCRTTQDKKMANQKMVFRYNLPLQFEPEDPTVPFGRQTVVLAGKPVVQFFFERAPLPAGDRGENLQPMQCAFAKRTVRANEPNQVQILVAGNQITWMSQPLGQKVGSEKPTMIPAGDWTFTYQQDQVFFVDLDDTKTFVTSQMPKEM